MGETKRKTLKVAPASSKRASVPVALHSVKEVPSKQSTKRRPAAKAAPRRASMPSSPTGPLPDPSSKVICGRNDSGSLVTTNRDAQAASSAGFGASSKPRDAKATSAAPPSYLLEHITGDTSGTISSNSTATHPPTCTTNEGGYYVFGAGSSIDTLSPVSSQQTASRGRRSAGPLRASERNATDDALPLSLERISEERLSLSASSSQQTEGYFWNLAPSRSARHSVGGLAVPAAAVAVRTLPTAAAPPPRLSMSDSTSFESGVPYSMLQPPHKRPVESSFTAPAGASWRRFSTFAPSAAENAAGHELGLGMRVSEVNPGDVAASTRARSARLASGTVRQSRHTDDGDVHRMPSAFDTPLRVGSQLPSFFRAPMSASRRTLRRPTRGGGGESVLWNSVYSTNGGGTVVGNDADSTCASVAGWPQGGMSAFGDDADAFSMESAAGAGFQSFFAPGPGAASSTDYSPSCSAHTRARPSLRPHASGVSTGLSIFNGLPSAGASSSSSSDDDADSHSDAGDREIVTHHSALSDARAPQGKPKRQQQLSPWSSLYGVASKSVVPIPAKSGNTDTTLARQTSLFVGASQRGGVEEKSDRDESNDRDTTSPSTVSRRRCTLDRKGTLGGAAWALETGKGRVRTRNSRRGDSDSDSSSDEESSNGTDDSTTQHPRRNFSYVLIPQQRTSAAQRRSTITSYLNRNDSVSSVDVIANSSSSSSDGSDTEEDRRAVEEGRRTSLQRALSVMEKFSEISSDDDDGEAEAHTHVHEGAEAPEQANRPTAHTAPTPVPPSMAYGRYTNGRRTTTTAVAPPHFQRTLAYQPYTCSPQLPVLPRAPAQHQPYSGPSSVTPYGIQQAWGAGGGVHAVAYLHAQCPTRSTSPNKYGADEVDDWQTRLADFTSPGLTTHSTATCNNSDLTESSPATSTPLNGGPPTVQFRTTVTTLKVHELLGFDPLTEITTVRSPRWRSLPRHR